MPTTQHFDAIVVGSGFGGSVMAYRLAQAGLEVCLLERGKRYPPGSFARSPVEMRSNFWDPSLGSHGLYQVWRFDGIDGLVSAGLGGGSLIYANVLIRKDENWFIRRRSDGGYDPWPVSRAELNPHYDRVEAMLAPQQYPFDKEPYSDTPKTRAFQEASRAAGLDWLLPKLAVTFGDPPDRPVPGEPIVGSKDNIHQRTRYTCRLCGECDIGCNYGSKNTLDYNYLTQASKLGVTIRDRCEVRTFAPADEGGYTVGYVEHHPEDEGSPTDTKQLPTVEIKAKRLILAAGTFGSTFLLLKNRRNFPNLSDTLGRYFSGNGDLLGFILDAHQRIGRDRTTRVLAPSRGSVITSAVRVPDRADGGDGPGYYVQDGGYPGFVDWLVEASNAMGSLRRVLDFVEDRILAHLTHSPQTDIDAQVQALLGDAHRSASLLPLLGMGMDTPDGVMSLDDKEFLALNWTSARSGAYFDRVMDTMNTVASHLDARFEIDPLWYLHKKVVTVHPVGGCPMGDSSAQGVVDSYGEVFGYPGFVIADGSVMPGPVGPNPSFTIAALSDRFADHQLATGVAT